MSISALAMGAEAVRTRAKRTAAMTFFMMGRVPLCMSVLLLVHAGVADGHVNLGARDGRGSGEDQGEEDGGNDFFHDGSGSFMYVGITSGPRRGSRRACQSRRSRQARKR